MFQIYTYESDRWGEGHKWGQWDVTSATGVPFVAAMADFACIEPFLSRFITFAHL